MPKPFTEFQKEMAFDRYYAMGAKRDLKELLRNLQGTEAFPDEPPTYSTIKKWSMANNWQEQCKQRDIENAKKVEAKTDREVVKTKAAYRVEIGEIREELKVFRQRVEKLIADATEAIEKKQIKVGGIPELDQVISSLKKFHDMDKDYVKLDLQLIGEGDGQEQRIVFINDTPRPDNANHRN
jgi:hypothetical protein